MNGNLEISAMQPDQTMMAFPDNGTPDVPVPVDIPIEIDIPDERNLSLYINKDELSVIGQDVVREFNEDIQSRSEFDKRRATWRKLFLTYLEEKEYPWPSCSNVSLPFVVEACLQFQARAYEALIGKDIVKCYTRDGTMKDAAERASKYMNYQLRYEMTEWEEDMDKLLMALPLDGVVVKKTYYDSFLERPVSMFLDVDEFVVNYKCRNIDDPMARKTHILWMHWNDIKIRQDTKIFVEPPNELDKTAQSYKEDGNMPETRQVFDDGEGVSESAPENIGRLKLLEQHKYLDINYDPVTRKIKKSDGLMRPYVVTVDFKTQQVLRIVSRVIKERETDVWNVDNCFTAYTFIPNPSSWMGIGFGQFLSPMNEAANTAINQLLDAGHLNNMMAGFVAKRSGMKKGDLAFEMGVFKEVDIMMGSLKDSIYEFKFKPPSNILFQLLGMLHEYSKEVSTAAEWMSGKLPPSDTAATTMLAIIEQGLKVFSVIQKRCHRAFGKELRKIFAINRHFLKESVYALVQDKTSREWQSIESGRKDFSSNIEIIPVSDPNITSRAEKLIKSQQVLGEAKQNPLMAQNPESLYWATREYLEALEATNIDAMLKKPEPPPPPPDIPPEEENAMFIKDQMPKVLPNQNHMRHLAFHEGFIESQWAVELTPNGKNNFDSHLRDHKSFLYLQEEKQRQLQAIQQQQLMEGSNVGY
jgi:hypothetical protein